MEITMHFAVSVGNAGLEAVYGRDHMALEVLMHCRKHLTIT